MDTPAKASNMLVRAAFSPYDDGVRALLDAKQLSRADGGVTSALLLCRAALRHLVRATLLDGQRIEVTSSEAELWQQGRLLPLAVQGAERMPWLTGAERWFERFVVSPTGDLELAQLEESEKAALLRDLLGLAFELAAPLDRARNGAVRRVRWRWRLGLFVAVLVLALAGLSLRAALAPHNLARGKAVVVVDPDLAFGLDPALLVDGDQLTMAFHTSRRQDPSVTIDLGALRPISRIEIYNRVECCYDRAVPLEVQVSKDGRRYATIDREKHSFSHVTVRLPTKREARYVRLLRRGTEVFHLAEVEVY